MSFYYTNLSFAKGLLAMLCLFMGVALLPGCSGGADANAPTDSPDSGTIHISADESFKPVIDAQIAVYEGRHPKAKIIAHYKPEADCLRDLLNDSIRVVITTRTYSPAEKQAIFDSLGRHSRSMTLAYDALAVIVHPSSPDTLLTMAQLKGILTGRADMGKQPVFDGTKATSTVRFALDSVLRGEKLSDRVAAAQSSKGVIDYVARSPKSIGFLGVSWVGNPQDSTQLSYLSQVKVVKLEHPLVPETFVSPAQFNIYYRRYPMVRDLVYVLKENHDGLGRGFTNFMTTQGGQLLFNRSYLMPAIMDFELRDADATPES